MTEKEIYTIERIKEKYEEKRPTKLDELKALDCRVKLPALVFAYVFGIIGALVLGFGMCMAMEIIFSSMAMGIVIGCVGIFLVAINYPIYKKMLEARIRKYAEKINTLSDEILAG